MIIIITIINMINLIPFKAMYLIMNMQYAGGGAGLKNVHKKYSFSVAANLQHASLRSKLKDSSFYDFSIFCKCAAFSELYLKFYKIKDIQA